MWVIYSIFTLEAIERLLDRVKRVSCILVSKFYSDFSFITRKTMMQDLDMDTSDPMIKKKSSTSSVSPIFKWKVLTIVFNYRD